MKNLKKVLALVLALGLILSTFTALTTVSAEEEVAAETTAEETVAEETAAEETAEEEAPAEEAEETTEVVAISADSVYSFSDTEGTEYADAAEVLSALNIAKGYEDGTFGGDKTVTRAEMSAFIVRAIGLGAIAESAAVNASSFSDVDAKHWAVGSINIANEKNIINGLGDGRFAPDKTVEYQAAVKMLVCALGYNVVATRNGGWPQGFLIAGAQIGLTDGITGVAGTDGCSRGIVAQLLFNALEINLMQETVYAGSAVQIEETGFNLLFDNLGVVRMFDAEITGTPTQGNRTSTGFARIRGVRHIDVTDDQPNPAAVVRTAEIGNTNPEAFYGDSIVAYYKFNGDNKNPTLLCILEDNVRQETFELNVADLFGDDADKVVNPTENTWDDKTNNTNYTRVYYKTADDAKAQFIKLRSDWSSSEEFEIIVNGSNSAPATGWDFIEALENGTIKFIDAEDSEGNPNPDGVYEKAVIDTYWDFVVSEVDGDDLVVSTKNEDTEITLDETKTFTIFDVDGEEVKVEDLQENDVISVYPMEFTDLNDKYDIDSSEVLRIIVSSNTVEGVVTEKTTKGIYLDDEFYEIHESDVISYQDFEVGDEGIFYLNADGILSYADATSAAKEYALVYDVFADNSRRVTLNALSSTGETLELVMQGSVDVISYAVNAAGDYARVDLGEYNFTTNQQAAGALVNVLDPGSTGNYAPYLIGYDLKKGSNIQIDKIYLAGAGIANVSSDNRFASRFGIWASDVSSTYNTVTSVLADYIVDASTVIFNVPSTVLSADDADKIKVMGKSGLVDDKDYDHITVYEVDKKDVARAMLIRSSESDVDFGDAIAIIQNISLVKNADGDEVYKLYMIQNGREVVKMTEDTSLILDYGTGTEADGYTAYSLNIGYAFYPGAAIFYNEASDGAIDAIEKIYPVPTMGDDEDENDTPYYITEFFTTWQNSRVRNWYKDNCECFIVYGQVAEKNSNGLMRINTIADDDEGGFAATTKLVAYSGANVTVVNYKFKDAADQVKTGSASDIKEGDYVLVRTNSSKVKDVVVYKNFDLSNALVFEGGR